jgi:hypothetical protein
VEITPPLHPSSRHYWHQESPAAGERDSFYEMVKKIGTTQVDLCKNSSINNKNSQNIAWKSWKISIFSRVVKMSGHVFFGHILRFKWVGAFPNFDILLISTQEFHI